MTRTEKTNQNTSRRYVGMGYIQGGNRYIVCPSQDIDGLTDEQREMIAAGGTTLIPKESVEELDPEVN